MNSLENKGECKVRNWRRATASATRPNTRFGGENLSHEEGHENGNLNDRVAAQWPPDGCKGGSAHRCSVVLNAFVPAMAEECLIDRRVGPLVAKAELLV